MWNTAGLGSWVTVVGSTPLAGPSPGNGVITNDAFVTIPFSTPMTISKMRFRFHYYTGGWNYWVYTIAYHSVPLTINAPTITTLNPNVDLNSADFQGQIVDDGGGICAISFEWGLTAAYGNTTTAQPGYTTGTICGTFLGGLATGTQYHCRLDATNSAGTTHGNDIAFTPVAPHPGLWIVPTSGNTDPAPPSPSTGTWQNIQYAYDDDDLTASTLYVANGDASPGSYLYLTHAATYCDEIRVKADLNANITAMEISVNQTVGGWTVIYSNNTYTNQQWLTVPFASASIMGARIRFSTVIANVGFTIAVTDFNFHLAVGPDTQLAITSVNGGANPTAGAPFNVIVQSQDASGNPSNVVANTAVMLSLNSGGGALGGALSTTIPAGTNSITVSGVTYTKSDTATLKATKTSGDNLTPGISSPFTVNPAALDHFLVEKQGGGSIPNQFAGTLIPIQITAQDFYNNTQTSFVSTVTIAATSGALSVGAGATGSFTAGVLSPYNVAFSNTPASTQITAAGGGSTGSSVAFAVNAPAAATYIWTGAGGNGNLTNPANWSTGVAPPDYPNSTIDFTGNAPAAVADTFPTWTLANIIFGNTSAFALSGNPLQFSGAPALTQNSASNISISNAINLSVPTSFDGTGTGSLTLSGVLTGSAALTKSSTDTLSALAGSGSTFSGMIADNAGTLLADTNLSTAGTITVGNATLGGTGSVGAIVVNNSGTASPGDPGVNSGVGALTATSAIFNSGATLLIQATGTTAGTYDQLVLGAGSLTANSGAILSLTGALPTSGTAVGVVTYGRSRNGVVHTRQFQHHIRRSGSVQRQFARFDLLAAVHLRRVGDWHKRQQRRGHCSHRQPRHLDAQRHHPGRGADDRCNGHRSDHRLCRAEQRQRGREADGVLRRDFDGRQMESCRQCGPEPV